MMSSPGGAHRGKTGCAGVDGQGPCRGDYCGKTIERAGAVGFSVLRFWPFLDRFFGFSFTLKKCGFSVFASFAVCRFSFYYHLVFGFWQKCYSVAVFRI